MKFVIKRWSERYARFVEDRPMTAQSNRLGKFVLLDFPCFRVLSVYSIGTKIIIYTDEVVS
jgi:hypothetical protein